MLQIPWGEYNYLKMFNMLKGMKMIILSISLDSQFPDNIIILQRTPYIWRIGWVQRFIKTFVPEIVKWFFLSRKYFMTPLKTLLENTDWCRVWNANGTHSHHWRAWLSVVTSQGVSFPPVRRRSLRGFRIAAISLLLWQNTVSHSTDGLCVPVDHASAPTGKTSIFVSGGNEHLASHLQFSLPLFVCLPVCNNSSQGRPLCGAGLFPLPPPGNPGWRWWKCERARKIEFQFGDTEK